MRCPVCGGMDCVGQAHEVLEVLPTVFLPCPDCRARNLDKRLPLPTPEYAEPCTCGKRFIDEVFAHLYVVMVEEGDLLPTDPLIDVGSPLIHPGCAMDRPPFLPERSLVLLSSRVSKRTARRIVREVPEIRGVVKKGDFVPGLAGDDPDSVPKVYELYAGCDVRADIFPLPAGALVMFKQQSQVHIEFPRFGYPKLRSVAHAVSAPPAPLFVDACSGVGTLGLTAASLGVPHVIMNDAWYASAFWSAFNIEVNRESLLVDQVRISASLSDMARHPVARDPVKIAVAEGQQIIDVYHGDFRELPRVLPGKCRPVTALDLFGKGDPEKVARARAEWLAKAGGEVFVP